MDKLELTFKKERETKNTIRYQEETSSSPAIETLYIQKSVLGKVPPQRLKVTITPEE